MYYVYILKSTKDNSKYIGVTSRLKRRVYEHNVGNSSYGKKHKPFKLKWFCCFPNKEKAFSFEKTLKSSSGRAYINKHLI
jgi:predicted GIY-YIG superfamily endonuclease